MTITFKPQTPSIGNRTGMNHIEWSESSDFYCFCSNGKIFAVYGTHESFTTFPVCLNDIGEMCSGLTGRLDICTWLGKYLECEIPLITAKTIHQTKKKLFLDP